MWMQESSVEEWSLRVDPSILRSVAKKQRGTVPLMASTGWVDGKGQLDAGSHLEMANTYTEEGTEERAALFV